MTLAPAIGRLSSSRKRGSREPPRALAAASLRQTSPPHDPGSRVRGDDSRGERASADIFTEASYPRRRDGARRILVIACGALAREVLALRLDHIDVACLPAQLHNHPRRIPDAMRAKIRANRSSYDEILCLYGDCGTGGELDRVLEEEGVRRIDGAHCYAFYAGDEAFSRLSEEEPGTFYLTDFLVRGASSIWRSSTTLSLVRRRRPQPTASASPLSAASPASRASAPSSTARQKREEAPWPA